jgi:hypothetical protein
MNEMEVTDRAPEAELRCPRPSSGADSVDAAAESVRCTDRQSRDRRKAELGHWTGPGPDGTRGLPRGPDGRPPYKGSFVLSIDSARIGISAAALSDVLNRYTFAYAGSPLRGLTVTVEQGQLKQTGVMRGVSFTILADLLATPQGELRLHRLRSRWGDCRSVG